MIAPFTLEQLAGLIEATRMLSNAVDKYDGEIDQLKLFVLTCPL